MTFTYNSIIEKYPINLIITNILDFEKSKLEELSNTILQIYQYVIPNSFPFKKQYDDYIKNLQEIIKRYADIQAQKKLILTIEKELSNLPDCYIDSDLSKAVLSNAQASLKAFNAYEKRFYTPPKIDETVIESHNERFIRRHLDDPIFNNVNGKSLDMEQRQAILCDAESNLTIAGAGSGKTLTICGKVKYLLERQKINKDDILLLSYTARIVCSVRRYSSK